MIQGRTVLHEVVDAKLMDMCSGDLPVKKLFLEKEEAVDLQIHTDLLFDLTDYSLFCRFVKVYSPAYRIVIGLLVVVHQQDLPLVDDDSPDPVIEGAALHAEGQICGIRSTFTRCLFSIIFSRIFIIELVVDRPADPEAFLLHRGLIHACLLHGLFGPCIGGCAPGPDTGDLFHAGQKMQDRPQGLSRDPPAPQIAADAEAYLDRTGIRIIVVGADRTGKYERGIFF